jgi:ubiquinone biosynthesis protein
MENLMLVTCKNAISLFRIAAVMARHDALFICAPLKNYSAILWITSRLFRPHPLTRTQRKGERLACALVELGPTFIKLGQVLSTRSDLIGEDIAHDLALLQDSLPPFPTHIAIKVIEAELGAPIDALFQRFEEVPVAAASMAQVHFATTTQGNDVAVKILRPDIATRFQRDIALFSWLADIMERAAPELRRMRPKEMVQILIDSVEMELDLRYEAAAAVELKTNMEGEEGFYVPDIDWQRTSTQVLTLERIHGIAGNNIAGIRAAGHDVDQLLSYAANAFFCQVFRDGFFHADMHPGNLFIMPDGRIAVVDFGIMGRLDYRNRVFLAQILAGFLQEDYYLVAKVHADFGVIPPHKSIHQFAMACMAIGKPILNKNLDEISVAKLLTQLFKMSETFEMRLQPQLLLLQKTMMLAEGIGRSLNPRINMWKMSEPMIMSWYKQNLSAPAMAFARIEKTVEQLQRLPEVLESFNGAFHQLSKGTIAFDPQTLHALNRYTRRPWWGYIALISLVLILILETLA